MPNDKCNNHNPCWLGNGVNTDGCKYQKPKFDIVIPVYNRPDKVKRAIDSVLNQNDFHSYRIYVINDGSTDNTEEVCLSYGDKITYIKNVETKGPAYSRNNGIVSGLGQYICFLDSDDWFHPNKLKTLNKLTNEANIIYHDSQFVTPDGTEIEAYPNFKKYNAYMFPDNIKTNHFQTPSLTISRNLFIYHGLFNESLMKLEDYDLLLRLLSDNHIYYHKEKLSYITINDDTSLSHKKIPNHPTKFDVLNDFLIEYGHTLLKSQVKLVQEELRRRK